MIGTSRSELTFIRVCIFFLHYLAPASVAYCILLVALYGFEATTYRFPLFVETIAFAETAFYFLVYTPYRIYLQREAIHPPQLDRAQREELFTKCHNNIPDIEAYLRKWFLGAPLEEIKKDNLKDFFLWAFFDRGGAPGKDDEELEEYVKETEELLGRKIQPGRGNAKALRLTLDNVDMLHRSLTWYFVGYCGGECERRLMLPVCWLCRSVDLHSTTIAWFPVLQSTIATVFSPLPFPKCVSLHKSQIPSQACHLLVSTTYVQDEATRCLCSWNWHRFVSLHEILGRAQLYERSRVD